MNIRRYITRSNIAVVLLFLGLYFYGYFLLFALVYFSQFLFVCFRALQSSARKRTKSLLIITYLTVMIMQIVFYVQVLAGNDYWMEHPLRKFFAIAIMALPMTISRYVAVNKYTELYLPTFQEAATISFSQIREFADSVMHAVEMIKKAGGSLSPGNFKAIINDLPRHDPFNYVNNGSLTEEYFRIAEASFSDFGLYIVISNTGTPASEIISIFTQKQFNHASLSFDAALQTIVSYNGGERVYPPGLNYETLDFFNMKPDASILVYRLPVTLEQKKAALDKIEQINREGSAYNLLGLLINHSYKPNIMYCSQFVYKILESIGAEYFNADEPIKPTDLIEKDYYRKLVFVEELRLNAGGFKAVP